MRVKTSGTGRRRRARRAVVGAARRYCAALTRYWEACASMDGGGTDIPRTTAILALFDAVDATQRALFRAVAELDDPAGGARAD